MIKDLVKNILFLSFMALAPTVLGCAKVEYTVEIRPIKAAADVPKDEVDDLNRYIPREIAAIRKLKKVKSGADKIIEADLYKSGNKTHLDIRLLDAKTGRLEYENKRFWKDPKIHDLRFLAKKIFVDMEMNHFKWNRGLMK